MRIVTLLACLVTLELAALPVLADARADHQAGVAALEQLYDAGDYAGAEVAGRALVAQATEAFGPDSAQALDVQITLANALRQQDKLEESVALFRHVHARWLATKGEYFPQTLTAANALSVILSETGRADEALPLAVQTLRVAESVLGEKAYVVVRWRYNLASIYNELGYKDEALAYYAQALQQMRAAPEPEAPRDAATVARTIARTYSELRRPDAAADAYAEAIPLFDMAFGPRHPQTIYTLVEYGQELWRSGRRDDLPAHVQKVGALVDEVFGADSLLMTDVLAQRALLATQGGPGSAGFAEGLALQGQVVALRESLLSPKARKTGRARLDYAAMLADTTDPAQLRRAWEELKLAAEAESGSRSFAYGLLADLRASGGMTPGEVADAVLQVAQEAQGSSAAASSLIQAQRLALGEGEAAAQFRAATDLGERSAQLQAALLVQTNLPLAERDAAREGQMRRDLAEARQKADALWAALDVSAPGMMDLIGGGRMTLAEVQAALAPDEALLILDISPVEGDAHMAMAISRESADWTLLNWTADSFSGAVADTRAGIALKLGTRAAAALDDAPVEEKVELDLFAAQWLYTETIGALEPVFADKAHLLFDLRGAVAGLPPQLLVRREPQSADLTQADWLIRHHAVSVLPSVFSLRTIALARGRAPAPEPLLAFADPVYDLDEGTALVASLDAASAGVLRGALAPLPETADEVRAVAAALGAPPAALRTGAAASEAGLKETRLSDFRVLHFATHGLVTGDVAGQTVLGEPALALTPGRGEDGFLTVSEILALDLRADWVVLSACNTAKGNDPDAEALSGLAQAFFYAGARALMVSHWPVESRSAAHLMTETFRIRAETPGLRAAEAQRRAALAMIDAPDGKWSHPAYWAPFVLVGSPD